MYVPFVSFKPLEKELNADLRAAFERVLVNSWYIDGNEDKAFEAAFAAYCDRKHCIGNGNGLDALMLVLKAWGIGEGDEVFHSFHKWLLNKYVTIAESTYTHIFFNILFIEILKNY